MKGAELSRHDVSTEALRGLSAALRQQIKQQPTVSTMTATTAKDHSWQNACGHDETISALHEAWQFCRGELEGKDLTREAKGVLWEVDQKFAENLEGVAEAIEERAREQALSVELRSGWYTPGEQPEAEEGMILLSTGGPALRLLCDVSGGGLIRPRLEHQDWGTPWMEMFSIDREAWEWFAGLFYVGEC